jgi:hypothetical protein
MRTPAATSPFKLVEYDSIRRRLWIFGQRCHHGATGSVVAGLACAGLIAEAPVHGHTSPRSLSSLLAAVATGCALMAHDWHDHTIWFERGHGTQP